VDLEQGLKHISLLHYDEDVSVHELVMKGRSSEQFLTLEAVLTRLVVKLARAVGSRKVEEGEATPADSLDHYLDDGQSSLQSCDTDLDSDASEVAATQGLKKLVEAATGAASSSKGDVSKGDASSGEEVVGGAKAKPATHTVWSNEYFYITDHPGFPDIKIRMHSQWATTAHMGHYAMSKTIIPSHYGETKLSSQRSRLILQAWALYRGNLENWADGRRGRSNIFKTMEKNLLLDVRNLGSPKGGWYLGSKKGDQKLREWAPSVYAALSS
jgi:hypothetical protein